MRKYFNKITIVSLALLLLGGLFRSVTFWRLFPMPADSVGLGYIIGYTSYVFLGIGLILLVIGLLLGLFKKTT